MRGGNLDYITEFFKTLGENIEKTTKDLGKNIENATQELGNNIENATQDLGKNIENATQDLGNNIENIKDKMIIEINKVLTEFEDNEIYKKFNDEDKKIFDKWTVFITRYVKSECKTKEECDIEEANNNYKPLSIEDAKAQAKDIVERFMIQKKNKTLIRDNAQIQGEKKELTVIERFDKIFLEILALVSLYFGKYRKSTKVGCSQQFKTMISLLRTLPNIDENLTELVKEDIADLKGRYDAILNLLKDKCSGTVTKHACSFAALALGKDISALYDKLKANSEIPNFDINETTLLDFIKMVVPIMIQKLINIEEFNEARDDLIVIGEELKKQTAAAAPAAAPAATPAPAAAPAAKGGKKSSGTVRKEILGKLMKIYRIPNDKKEYVRHKGHLISVKQYKEEAKAAKAANHAKPAKPAKPAKHTKKVILGKERCIYKVQGSKKDHIKHKGALIPVADYKKLMGAQ
jgi:hypothetical protein